MIPSTKRLVWCLLSLVLVGGCCRDRDECDEITASILDELSLHQDDATDEGYLPPEYYGTDGEPEPCGQRDSPASGHPFYREACDELRECLDEACGDPP